MKIATLVFILKNGQVLLGRKKQGEIGTGKLNGPGGKQKPGETLPECALRETREEAEIGLDPDALIKVAIVTTFTGEVPEFEVHVYKTEVFIGGPTETKDMVTDWYPIDNLPFDEMHESDKEWLSRALATDELFRAHVFYQERDAGFAHIMFLPEAEE